MKASKFVWEAAGRPPLVETDGTPIPPRKFSEPGRCASCGSTDAPFGLDDAISEKFTTVRNNNILWPFGGRRICHPCAWCCKTLALRCAMGFAKAPNEQGEGGGVWFLFTRPPPRPADLPRGARWFSRPDAMEALLNPPEPPFVAWCPLYGIQHGGEAHVDRCLWPSSDGTLIHRGETLTKLQTKHTIPYANISLNRERYDIAIDEWNTTIDVPLWRSLRTLVMKLLTELRAAGVGAMDARASLVSLHPPHRAPLHLAAPSVWSERVAPLRPHVSAAWWGFFTELLPMPDLPTNDPNAEPQEST